MSDRCADARAALVVHIRGELVGLPAERLEAHLRNCAACRAVRTDIEAGLAAAAAVVAGSDQELAVLARRIAVSQPAPARPPRIALGIGAGALALAAVAAAVIVQRDPEAIADATAIVGAPESTDAGSGANADEIALAAPVPEVRMIRGPTFVGEIDVLSDDAVIVDQRDGFATYAFRGSASRARMEVRTPSGTIRVVGTLFFVDVREGVTRVGVRTGKVLVTGVGELNERALVGGDRLALGSRGPVQMTESAAERFLDDPALVAFHDQPVASAIGGGDEDTRGIGDNDRAPDARNRRAPAQANVADRIVEAAELARAGRPAAARARLAETLGNPSYARAKDVLRYEIARLDGLALDEPKRARTTLRELASSASPSLRVQAALTICELDLAIDRCAVRACLERARAGRGILGEEAARLEQRWGVREATCPPP